MVTRAVSTVVKQIGVGQHACEDARGISECNSLKCPKNVYLPFACPMSAIPAAIKTGLDFGRLVDSSTMTKAYAMTKAETAGKPAVWLVRPITLPVVPDAIASPEVIASRSSRAMIACWVTSSRL